MQIKVTLTEAEAADIRHYLTQVEPEGKQRTVHGKLMGKLGKALDKPAAAVKSISAKQLWQVIGRPDLKGSLEACKVVVIAGERIVECWRMAEGSIGTGEPCAQCGRALGRARLSVIGGPDVDCDPDGTVRVSQHLLAPSLAHKACGSKWLGIVKAERSYDPASELAIATLCACGHETKRHAGGKKGISDGACLQDNCSCLEYEKAKPVMRMGLSTAYQRLAVAKPTWRDGAIDMTAKWDRWESTVKTEEEQVA